MSYKVGFKSHCSRALKSLRLTQKKTLLAQEQDREDIALKRQQWIALQSELDPDRVVFLDETWAKTNMTRNYGRSEKGSRVVEKTPCGRLETNTFFGAIRATGFIAAISVEGPSVGGCSKLGSNNT